MKTTEQFERRHDRWQDAMLWTGSLGVLGMALEAGGWLPEDTAWEWVGFGLRALGWTAFVAIWLRLMLLTGRDDQLLTAAVEDERVQQLRSAAMVFALNAVLVLQFALLLLEPLRVVRQSDSAGLTFAVAMVAALWHFRRGARR